jgi:hypothetical protein
VEFLQQYVAIIRAAGGDGRVMANWFMMATKGEPRRWLCRLPRGPFRPGGTSASSSSTGTHPWDLSQRVRRPTPSSMAPSPGTQRLGRGLRGHHPLALG